MSDDSDHDSHDDWLLLNLTTLDSLAKQHPRLSAKWKELGKALKLNEKLLLDGARKHSTNIRKLGECFSQWITSPNNNWDVLIEALLSETVKEKDLAYEIIEKLEAQHEELQGDYSELLAEGLEEGFINTKWTKFTISGPPGSGKTSALKMLFDNDDNKTQDETDVGGGAQKEGGVDRKKPIISPHDSTPVIQIKSSNFIVDGGSWTKVTNVRDIVKDKDNSIITTNTTNSSCDGEDSDGDYSDEEEENENDGDSSSVHFIYAVDTGGQAAFLDIAPALLRYNSVNIVTHKLDESLDDKIKFFYSWNNEYFDEPEERQITHRQLLMSSVRLTSFEQIPQLQRVGVVSKPSPICFLILGTHLDMMKKYENCNNVCSGKCSSDKGGECLPKKNKELEKSLSNFLDKVQMNGTDLIFPVDTRMRDEGTRFTAKRIRRKIEEVYIDAKIPKKWFAFQTALKECPKQIVSLEKCYEIGSSVNMKPIEVRAALLYYHDLTAVLYFPKVLPELVFLNPQPLFNKLSEIVLISIPRVRNLLVKQLVDISLTGREHKDFSERGLFNKKLLHSDGFHFSDFSVNNFLKLTTSLYIIGEIRIGPKVRKYFLPSILKTCKEKDLEDNRQTKRNVSPLLFVWKGLHVVPQGFFCALVLHLLRQPTIDEDNFVLEKDIPQYRNVIRLPCYKTFGGIIILVDAVDKLEVHYTGECSKCYDIQVIMTRAIRTVGKEFHFKDDNFDFRFFCMICPLDDDKKVCNSHTCAVSHDKTTLTCLLGSERKTGPMGDTLKPWFEHVQPLKDAKEPLEQQPPLDELLNHIKIGPKWYILGIQLLPKDSYLLDELHQDRRDATYKTARMFSMWLNKTPHASRKQLVEALKSSAVELISIAIQYEKFIEDMLKN